MEPEQKTEVDLPVKGSKKARSPAQIEATRKALEVLQEKRKQMWEEKKKDIASTGKVVKVDPAKVAEKLAIPQKTETPVHDMPEWAKALSEKVEKLTKPKKKRVIVEESDTESEEEVVVRRRKKRSDTPPPPPPASPARPAVYDKPPERKENPLKAMLYKR